MRKYRGIAVEGGDGSMIKIRPEGVGTMVSVKVTILLPSFKDECVAKKM